MATYREIKGLTVPYLDADLPSASADTQEGGVWYNSATGKLRAFVAADTWATSAPKTNATEAPAGAGIQTAGLAFGGLIGPGPQTADTEEWDGSAWTEVADLPAATSRTSGIGTSTLALQATGGEPISTATSEWTVAQNIKTIAD